MVEKTKVYFSWAEFDRAVDEIARKVSVFKFSNIYGVPRGGLILAVALSHKLDKPISLVPVKESSLVVDDISDTGQTLSRLSTCLLRTATIHFVRSSIFEPDAWVFEKAQGAWVVYPWEVK